MNSIEVLNMFVIVSIPQAVSTVATTMFIAVREFSRLVSIPQAVSTVATDHMNYSLEKMVACMFQYRKR